MRLVSAVIHDEGIRAVFLVVIGFLVAQLSDYFTARRERKKVAAQTLTELLEVRHHFVALETAMQQIENAVGNVPEHEKSQLYVALISILPKWEDLHSRYDQSVTTLAGLDPLLAFELRSKDFILPLVSWLHSLMGQDAKAASRMGPVLRTNVLSNIEPLLRKSIVKLAWKKGVFCWYRTRQFLKGRPIPEEAQAIFAQLKTAIETAKQEAAKTAAAPRSSV